MLLNPLLVGPTALMKIETRKGHVAETSLAASPSLRGHASLPMPRVEMLHFSFGGSQIIIVTRSIAAKVLLSRES